jgi:gliding motility-associated-like protein
MLLLFVHSNSYAQSTSDLPLFKARYYLVSEELTIVGHVNTKDAGTVMIGYVSKLYAEERQFCIIKVNHSGRVEWGKKMSIVQYSDLRNYVLQELSDGNIIVEYVANRDLIKYSNFITLALLKFGCDGDLLWSKMFALSNEKKSTIEYLLPYHISEGQNKDLILSFHSYITDYVESSFSVTRIDRDGNLIWNKTYHYKDDFNIFTKGPVAGMAFYQDGKIVVAGCYNMNRWVNRVYFAMHLDYANGNILLQKDFILSEMTSTVYTAFTGRNILDAVILDNKRLSIFGKFLGLQDGLKSFSLDLDEHLDIVKKKLYTNPNSDVNFPLYAKVQKFKDGSFNIEMMSSYDFTKFYFFRISENDEIKTELQRNYQNLDYLDFRYSCSERGKGALSEVQPYVTNRKSYAELTTFKESGQNIACVGSPIKNCIVSDLEIYPQTPRTWTKITDNQFYFFPLEMTSSNIEVKGEYECLPTPYTGISKATQITINGKMKICQPPYQEIYVANSNGTHAKVEWNYNVGDYQNIEVLNDSSISVTYHKPITETQLSLSASVSGCYLLKDEKTIELQPATEKLPKQINLCSGAVMLNVDKNLSDIVWQDGSVEKDFQVSQPGLYHFSAKDLCGDNWLDTTIAIKQNYGQKTAQKLCIGDSVELKTSMNVNGSTWRNTTDLLEIPNGAIVFPKNNQVYIIDGQVDKDCLFSDTFSIQVSNPKLLDVGKDISICKGESIELTASENNEFDLYKWSNGSNENKITISKQGIYTVSASDKNGCVANTSYTILFKNNCATGLFVPTAFTPNNDGKNDYFRVLSNRNVAKFSMLIYNRFGTLIFKSTDINRSWDGTIDNQLQNTGSFVWVCTYSYPGDNTETLLKGTVTLIR